MRRTISSLMVLGMISGCGGGSDTSGSGTPAADTQAPVLALAAPATIEGGQTAALSATVTDNVSTGLTPAITCTGGTLTGTMLATPVVTAATTITCTATATDAAGNRGSASVSISVQPRTATLSAAAGSTNVSVGGLGVLYATALTLDQPTYEGTLGGRTVRLTRDGGDRLIFAVPVDAPTGAQRMTVTIGTRSYSFDLTIAATTAPGDPRGAVRTALIATKANLSNILATDSTLPSARRATLQEQLGRMDAAIAAVDGASDADIRNIATIFAANGLINTAPDAYNPIKVTPGAGCSQKFATLSKNAAATVVWGAVLAGSVDAAIALAIAAPPSAIFTTIFAGIGVGLGSTLSVYYARQTKFSIAPAYEACWTETSFELLPDFDTQRGVYAKPISATAAKQSFRNNISKSYKLRRSFAPIAAIRGEAAKTISALAGTLAEISFFPADVRAALADFRLEDSEIVPPGRVSLTSITNPNVRGSITSTGDRITLNFRIPDPQPGQQNIDFQFNLERSDGEDTMIVPAQLTLALPEADDAAITVIQGQLTSSTAGVRGADTVEVVAQPAHGTVTLLPSGAFAFTPAGQYFGTDSFTYRAHNTDGYSRTATVAITIVRRFEGVWNMTSQSTTTSQSSPGLCPNEANSFSITVSKISDTQYTTSYQGFPITLTMASASDPAGLAGSTTVTYPDDPGSTTETVNARIPDSSHITASGSFSYSGPNNSRCSGTTSVTGVRP